MSNCPCENIETTPCPKEKDKKKEKKKEKKKCPPLGINEYVPPPTTVSNPINQLQNKYTGICPSCSVTTDPKDVIRCGPYPRYEANRQSIQKCRDPNSCIPQSSDQLVIYNTFCPSTSKGKTTPSLHVTTITRFEMSGPPQFVIGSTPAIPPFPPIIIPQPLFWYESFSTDSCTWDYRDVTTRSFNTGWLNNTQLLVATSGLYRLSVKVYFIGVGSIITFIFDFLPGILKDAVLYVQYDDISLDLDNPIQVGSAPYITFSTVINITDPRSIRIWIVTALPGIIQPNMTLTKLNECSGTSIEHLNLTKGPNYIH